MRSGFTLIELLVVLAIIVVIGALIMGATGGFSGSNFEAEVSDKWTDLDGDGAKLYRVRTISPTGEVDTWNSYWCHNDVQVGVSYKFNATGNYLRSANRLAVQPVRVPSQ